MKTAIFAMVFSFIAMVVCVPVVMSDNRPVRIGRSVGIDTPSEIDFSSVQFPIQTKVPSKVGNKKVEVAKVYVCNEGGGLEQGPMMMKVRRCEWR